MTSEMDTFRAEPAVCAMNNYFFMINQMPRLLLISAHNMVRLLVKNCIYIIFEMAYILFSACVGVTTISVQRDTVTPFSGIIQRLLRCGHYSSAASD